MMFSVSLFLQQYLHNIHYGKFFILTICAIVLKIYELAIPIYNRTRQQDKSIECAQQYSHIYQMFWYMITTTHNTSFNYVIGRTTYYYGKYQFYMYHANRRILYKKEYDPSVEILFDYSYIKSVAADIAESPTLFQISEK